MPPEDAAASHLDAAPPADADVADAEPALDPFELHGNRLTIRVETEEEFLAQFEEYFWQLMHSERKSVVLDLCRSRGLADDAFRIIALNMFDIGYREKEIIIRVPENLERFFRHSTLYRVAEIEIVRILGREEEKAHDKHTRQAMMNEVFARMKKDLDAVANAKKQDLSSRELALADLLKERFRQSRELAEELPGTVAVLAPPSSTQGIPPIHTEADATIESESSPASRGYFGDTAPPAEATRAGVGRLVDRRTGQIVEVNKNPTNIGRIPGNDILITMPLVSKRHARITRESDGAYYIEDLNSANGTYLNGLRLAGRKPLREGARVQIAITSQYPNGAKEYTFRQDP